MSTSCLSFAAHRRGDCLTSKRSYLRARKRTLRCACSTNRRASIKVLLERNSLVQRCCSTADNLEGSAIVIGFLSLTMSTYNLTSSSMYTYENQIWTCSVCFVILSLSLSLFAFCVDAKSLGAGRKEKKKKKMSSAWLFYLLIFLFGVPADLREKKVHREQGSSECPYRRGRSSLPERWI